MGVFLLMFGLTAFWLQQWTQLLPLLSTTMPYVKFLASTLEPSAPCYYMQVVRAARPAPPCLP